MLRSALFLTLFLPSAVLAANYQDMSSGNMQEMMGQMQKMQVCMEKIDQNKMNELQARSEQFNREVEALCAQGKRDKAQEKALSFGREISADLTMKQLRECSSYAEGMIPGIPQIVEEDYRNRHVCDPH